MWNVSFLAIIHLIFAILIVFYSFLDQQAGNDTRVPVPHSTDNYDVTVVSSSETESITTNMIGSDSNYDTDYDYTENHTTDSYDQDITTNTASDKQKITVELNEESSLESVSVIPEENIAVLVVTTEKAIDKDNPPVNAHTTRAFPEMTKVKPDAALPINVKEKAKSTTPRGATTISDGTSFYKDATKPIIISLPNLKHKTKPTKGTTIFMHGTRYTLQTTRPSLTTIANLNENTKTSTTKDASNMPDYTEYTEDSSKPTVLSVPNLKQKTKTSTTKIFSTILNEENSDSSTPVLSSTYEVHSSTEPTKYSTHAETDFKENNKELFNYEYAEYDDVTLDAHETFAPFEDYSEPSLGEGLTSTERTTENNGQQSSTTIIRSKIKTKTPPGLITRDSSGSTITSFTNSKFATEGLTASGITESQTYPDSLKYDTDYLTETDKYTYNPTLYTTHDIPSEMSSGMESRGNQKQKIKPYRPANNKYAPSTIIGTTDRDQTVPYTSTTVHQNGEKTVTDQTLQSQDITETNEPSRNTVKQSSVFSNHKQKPQRLSHTTLPYQSTKPLPQDLAELLWTINQNYNSQPAVTSTETYQPTIMQESFTSKTETSGAFADNLSSLIVAAPKLIVEDTTPHENYGTMELETTITDVSTSDLINPNGGSSQPNVMFNAAEIIFSNHGPVSHRKHPQPNRDPYISGLQTIRGPGLHGQKNPGLQTVKRPSLQTVKNSGTYGAQIVRNPGPSNIQTVKDTGLSNVPYVPDPGYSNIPHVRDPGSPGIQSIKQPTFPGFHRPPDPPLEINNHKKVLRPRPTMRYRPSPTPSLPQSSMQEISNHRPIYTFRRPSTKFPPYPSYNQRSEIEYRSQQNSRYPHHSLHRIDTDLHPEWREDYDEYYYDFEQAKSSPTKIFTNMQTTGEAQSTKITEPHLQETTSDRDFDSKLTTNADAYKDGIDSTTRNTLPDTTKTTISDRIINETSSVKISDTTEKTTQSDLYTTPYPSSKQTAPTTYSRDSGSDDDGKLSRADDNMKISESTFIDQHRGQYEDKINKFEVIDGRPSAEKPVLKPFVSASETSKVQTVNPTTPEEDSKEINGKK